ncbi:hypothetical protein B0H13DRAFT_640967 [Mycena leptocephala]|nr:hypothetical protein B0H13DRAFT_640967 [Mycena leptocephala]
MGRGRRLPTTPAPFLAGAPSARRTSRACPTRRRARCSRRRGTVRRPRTMTTRERTHGPRQSTATARPRRGARCRPAHALRTRARTTTRASSRAAAGASPAQRLPRGYSASPGPPRGARKRYRCGRRCIHPHRCVHRVTWTRILVFIPFPVITY